MKLISVTINGEECFLYDGMELQYALKWEEIKMVRSKEYSLYVYNGLENLDSKFQFLRYNCIIEKHEKNIVFR